MIRSLRIPLTLIVAVIAAIVFPLAAAGATTPTSWPSWQGTSDGPQSAASGLDTGSAIVQLQGDPLSTYVKTKPPHGKKIDFSSSTTRSYRAQLSAERNQFKQWLQSNAPKASVTGQYDISLNAVAVQLNGESLATVASAPLVTGAEYEQLFHPLADDVPDLGLINAEQAWNAEGGAPGAGAGVKVAVIDTGIDISNPCFSDSGYPAVQQLGDHSFTNNKVIVAKVFNSVASRNYTPAPIGFHGTHVAGTIACDFGTPVSYTNSSITTPVNVPNLLSGVAPRALLGNYNVFPNDITNAKSEDILNALEAAYSDGFDVANMSLGGGVGPTSKLFKGNQDLLTKAVDDLDQADMVVAIAAGNSGPGHMTVESPGSAARALTAGASSVGQQVANIATAGGDTYVLQPGDFNTVTSDMTAQLGVVSDATNSVNGLNTACNALPASSLTGKIALISRGGCFFTVKIQHAQDAGAIAVLVVNNQPGTILMATDGTPNQPTVPAYSLTLADGLALATQDGQSVTIHKNPQYVRIPAEDNMMADFSSEGPTPNSYRVKPDVVAPGVNVLSSVPAAACGSPPCFDFYQGTSMATPHLAGSAAVVIAAHPDWTAAQVRSAIVNTANAQVLTDFHAGQPQEADVNVMGAGLEDLAKAVAAPVTLDPVSVSFGAVPSGSGQTQTFDVTVTNTSGSAATDSITVGSGAAGVAYSVSPSSVSLAPGASATVTVTMSAAKGAAGGDHQAWLSISSGGTQVAHAAVYTFIK